MIDHSSVAMPICDDPKPPTPRDLVWYPLSSYLPAKRGEYWLGHRHSWLCLTAYWDGSTWKESDEPFSIPLHIDQFAFFAEMAKP